MKLKFIVVLMGALALGLRAKANVTETHKAQALEH